MTAESILVADDNKDIRDVLSSSLGTSGYHVEAAADGQTALDKFSARRHDLIIADLQMPRLEGLSLLERVKIIDPDVQVVILTGNATLETAVEALRLGAYDYLFKPVDMEIFGRLVERALKHRALLKENKRLVEELRQANARLETEVAERTQELRLANESLRSLDKLKSEFLSVVSHELRTPLSVILLESQILTQNADAIAPEKLGEVYMTLLTNARRLQILINNLLDFSLIERGALELDYKPCSINQIVRDVINLYEARAAEKSIRLLIDLRSDLSVNADGPRLRGALIHLVDNAIKFTPANGTITVSAYAAASMPGTKQPAIAVVVRDTGIGIASDRQQELFKAFSQADMSTTRRYGGMGMGLALAERIMAAHRGKVTFWSESGRGSVFALWVPAGRSGQVSD